MVALAGGSVYLFWSHSEWFNNPERVKLELAAFGVWAPLVYIALFAVGPSFLVPGAVMTLAGGLAFGAWRGAIYALVGANLGALVAFGAGRALGRSFVTRVVGARFQNLLDRVAAYGFRIILYLRIVPVIPYNALNLLAGASPIEFRDYFLASTLGMVPGTVLFAFLGDTLWHPGSPRFMLALGLIAACFAAGEVWRRLRPAAVEPSVLQPED